MAFTNLINYIKRVWKDAPSTDTPINAENLNHMENGISDAATAINQLGQNLTAGDDLRFQFSKSGNKYGYKDANGNFLPFKTAHTGTYTASYRSAALDMGEDHEYRYVNTNSVPNSNWEVYGTITTNGRHDMGSPNYYRYVDVSVPSYVVPLYENNGYSTYNSVSTAVIDTNNNASKNFYAFVYCENNQNNTTTGDFYVEGSNDGVNWAVLQSSSITISPRGAGQSRTFTGNSGYRFFRFREQTANWLFTQQTGFLRIC